MEQVQVEITGYSKKGHGLANTPRKIEVAGSVKGDILLVRPFKKKKDKLSAKLEEILSPSPFRRVPSCPHAGICGGCSSQQITYEAQLEEKQTRLSALFAPHSLEPITPSDYQEGYRGKMEFTFSQDKAGTKYLGLIMTDGRGKVMNLSTCKIAHPLANECLAKVRKWWENSHLLAYNPHQNTGSLRTLTFRSSRVTGSHMVILTVSGRSDFALSRADLDSFTKAVSLRENTSIFLVIQQAEKGVPTDFFEMHLKGPAYMEEELLGKRLRFGPLAFFQPNQNVAEKMFLWAIEKLALTGEEKVLDLCCGVGTIGILFAPFVRQVVGVELSKAAISDAKENIERLQIENMHVYQKDVKEFLENESFFNPDIVIVDPPRCGLGEKNVIALQKLKAKKIVYISCNPSTQADDLTFFTNYKVEQIAPFDQFPNTPHVENIILLTGK